MPNGTDDIFVDTVLSKHSASKKLIKVKLSKALKKTLRKGEIFKGFKIVHYATDVIYNASGFLSKNTDRVSPENAEMFLTSSIEELQEIFAPEEGGAKKGGGLAKKNIGYVFTHQLDSLIKTLELTDTHYVRCINPNKIKSSTEYDTEHVIKQLRCGGLIQALKVMKLGYPTRISYEALETQYRDKLQEHPLLESLDVSEYWSAVLAGFGYDRARYQFGLTKIFFKPNVPFIQDLKAFSGPFTDAMMARIRSYFVEKRMTKLRGMLKSYVRLSASLDAMRMSSLLSIPIIVHYTFGAALNLARGKLKQQYARQEAAEQERMEIEERHKAQEERLNEIKQQETEARDKALAEIEEKRLALKKEKKKAKEG
eukprot:349855_1